MLNAGVILNQSMKRRIVPLNLRLDVMPNVETMQAIEEAESLLRNPNARRYKSVEELFAELDRP